MKSLICTLVAMVAMVGSAPSFSHSGAPASKEPGEVDRTARPEQKPWGIAGNPDVVDRTISFSITERVRLTPESFDVAKGETLKIVLTNNGLLPHEFVIGTRQSFEEHITMTARDPQRGHGEPYEAQVPAGESAEIVWAFNKSGTFIFACPLAGHFLPDSMGTINVSANK
jgi:uncharacterized cupredoxin-like copper-binding protein